MAEYEYTLFQSGRPIAQFELQPDAKDFVELLRSKYPDIVFELVRKTED